MLTGYTSNFPNDVMFDNGIIKIGATVWGVTKGQSSFTHNSTIINSDFDGKTVPLKQLDRILHGEPVIQFTAVEIGGTATGGQLARLVPNGSQADSGTTPNTKSVVQPGTGNQFLVSGNYTADFRLIFERGQTAGAGLKKYCAVHFPLALIIDWGPLQGNNKDHPTYSCKVAGRIDPAGDLTKAAWEIELLESSP